jgi:hypothetical protein
VVLLWMSMCVKFVCHAVFPALSCSYSLERGSFAGH